MSLKKLTLLTFLGFLGGKAGTSKEVASSWVILL
jgi:hypothetical protein